MAKRKRHIFAYGYMQWQFACFEKKMRKTLRSFPDAKLPVNQFQAFHLFNLSRLAPGLFEGKAVEADVLRRELSQLMIQHPEFAGAALLFLSRKVPTSPTACVRDFLLTEQQVKRADGRQVNTLGATDKEIAAAVEAKYAVRKVSSKMVSNERRRLQKLCSVVVTDHVDALLKFYGAHRGLRQQLINSYYVPQ
jgi:hypothetical protein